MITVTTIYLFIKISKRYFRKKLRSILLYVIFFTFSGYFYFQFSPGEFLVTIFIFSFPQGNFFCTIFIFSFPQGNFVDCGSQAGCLIAGEK